MKIMPIVINMFECVSDVEVSGITGLSFSVGITVRCPEKTTYV